MGVGKGRWPFFDKDTMPLKRLDAASGVRHRARRVVDPRRRLPGQRRHLHAADVHQRRRLRRRRHARRLARAGRIVRADWQAASTSAPRRRLAASSSRSARCRSSSRTTCSWAATAAIYEGAIIKRRAVLASGAIVTGSTPVYDLPNERIIKPEPGQPLVVPEGAVVVPGARAVTVGAGKEWGLSLATPVIVKYRDEKTDARTELERWIR